MFISLVKMYQRQGQWLMVTMVSWKLIKLSIIDFILCLKLMFIFSKLIGVGKRRVNWQKLTISSISRQITSKNDLKSPCYETENCWMVIKYLYITTESHRCCLKVDWSFTMGNMTKVTILINYGKKDKLKMSSITPWYLLWEYENWWNCASLTSSIFCLKFMSSV